MLVSLIFKTPVIKKRFGTDALQDVSGRHEIKLEASSRQEGDTISPLFTLGRKVDLKNGTETHADIVVWLQAGI
jgi:hypothetical protein